MQYLFIPLWAALQIGFAQLFLSSFLAARRRKGEVFWVLVAAWLVTSVFGLLEVEGIYGYLIYLLMVVVILLSIYSEYGAKGLGLLAFSFLIPFAVDSVFLQLAADADGLHGFLTVTAGKLLPIALVLLLRCLKLIAPAKQESDTDRDTLLLRQHMELQKESMNALEQNYRLQRKSTHEFEHHLQVLGDLLNRNEITAAQEYLNKLKKNRSIHIMGVSSRHPIIDVILNQKYQTARENDIKVQIKVNDLSKVDIPTDSLVVVLTNLWDNAIEACHRIDGYREIFCSILYEDGLYISIRNTSNPVQILNGKIPTSKQDSLSHGFGLMSVGYVLDQLEAEYTFHYENGWFHFVAEIEQS